MRRAAPALWPSCALVSLAVGLFGCKGQPAQVWIVVQADPGVREQARAVTVTISGGERQTDVIIDGNIVFQRTEQTEEHPFPRRFALAPVDGDHRRLYRFVADAHRAVDGTDEPFVSTRVISGYQPGETLEIVLRLTDACVNVPCEDPLETCDPATRDCQTSFLDPSALMVARDAGMPDASRAAQCVDAVDCDDGVPCTIERCVGGECARTFDDSMCDDALDCTDGRCTAAGCTQQADDTDCDDGVPCTVDACDAARGCLHEPDDVLCTADAGGRCDAVTGCQYPTCSASNCQPQGPCFPTARCEGNTCVRDPLCDPGSSTPFCCGGTCAAPGCSDGEACTTDACGASGCTHAPRGGTCTDGDPCTQGDFCAAGSCQTGPVGCDDANECTANACGPSGCTSEDVPDGMACNGADTDGCQDRCYGGVCTPGICECTGAGDCVDTNPCTVNETCSGGMCSSMTLAGCTSCGGMACVGLCCSGSTCCGSGTFCCGSTCCPNGYSCGGGICQPPGLDAGVGLDAGGGGFDAGVFDAGGGFDAGGPFVPDSGAFLDAGGPSPSDGGGVDLLDGRLPPPPTP